MTMPWFAVLMWSFLLIFGSVSAWSQPYRPEQLMILVVGARSDGSDPIQAEVIERLRQLRGQPGLGELKMATMHFDRPEEAQFAQQVLGIRPQHLPCLALVQLDGAGQMPTRKIYAIPKITLEGLRQAEGMTRYWSAADTASFPPASQDPPPVPEPARAPLQWVAGVPIQPNAFLESSNRRFRFYFQDDGNLVVYRTDGPKFEPLWASRSERKGGQVLLLSGDGVLRLFDAQDELIWKSSNAGLYARYFVQMQDDGNLVIYRIEGRRNTPVWATRTEGR